MDTDEVLDRMDGRNAGIVGKNLSSEHYVSVLRRRVSFLQQTGGIIKVADSPPDHYTMHDLRSIIQEEEQRAGRLVDLIVVDYGSLLKASRKHDTFRHEERQKYVDLKFLANSMSKPLWSAMQLNRESFKKNTSGLGQLSEAYRAVDTCHAVFTINQNDEEQKEEKARLYIAKNRVGVQNVEIPILFNKATGNIRSNEELIDDLEEEDETE